MEIRRTRAERSASAVPAGFVTNPEPRAQRSTHNDAELVLRVSSLTSAQMINKQKGKVHVPGPRNSIRSARRMDRPGC